MAKRRTSSNSHVETMYKLSHTQTTNRYQFSAPGRFQLCLCESGKKWERWGGNYMVLWEENLLYIMATESKQTAPLKKKKSWISLTKFS